MMRHVLGMSAALAMTGGVVVGVSPALAGADEAHQDSFWANQSVSDPAYANHGAYLQVEPRDQKGGSSAPSGLNQADASNPYYKHAMGTMSGPDAVAEAPAASSNGQYTARYQQYLQVEPRDQAVSHHSNADSDNVYFYHNMGTMSRP